MQSGLVRILSVLLISITLGACDQTPSLSDNGNDIDTSAAAPPSTIAGNGVIGKQRPDFSLQDIEDKLRSVNEWNGKVLVINFWATWCPPCRKEMPAFIELQDQYGKQGLQFIGIAIDDKDKVTDFSDTYGVNYPMLLGTLEAIKLGKQYGNSFGALPYTVIVGRDGKIAYTVRGEFQKATAEAEIKKLL